MRKQFKKALISAFATVAVAAASTATALAFTANDQVAHAETTKFEMVDGAAIRLSTPNGLRFIAEMDADTYNNLVAKETGVTKEMGMIIVPYSYLSDASRYANGATGVANQDYAQITKKINHVFYNSDGSVANKLYKFEDCYRANGVISNLLLKNYDREFVGIGYIAETVNGVTTYTYADFEEENDVRSAVYVAIEAYDDYTDVEGATDIFENYVFGAHVYETLGDEVTFKDNQVYYNEKAYTSYKELADSEIEADYVSIYMDTAAKYMLVGKQRALTATMYNGDANGPELTFNDVHAVWTSSNEEVATVKDGVVTAVGSGTATITASFMGQTVSCDVTTVAFDGTFETYTAVPAAMSNASGRIENFSIVEMNGSKVLQATTTAASTSDVGVFITTEVLHAIFGDSSVEYMAFDLKSGATRTGTTVYYDSTGKSSWTKYESGGYDSIPVDSFKTYYFSRSAYESWVSAGATSSRFVMIGGSLVYGGESFYIDNIRGVTADEKTENLFSFEQGGVRTDNGNSPLFYEPSSGSWDIAFSNIDSTTVGFTSEIVSDGVRAFTFTKFSGDTALTFNHNTDTTMETAMRAAGYVSLDLHVPAGSDAKVMKGGYYSPLSEGWNTVYAKVDATANEWFRFNDTTASTYVVDNIQFVTEEEYYEKAYGFESGAGVLRTAEIGDASTNGGVFYYYGGADMTATYSFAFLEGTGTNDVAAISNPRYASDIKHSGNYSLAFDKGNGYLSVQMRSDSTAYSKLSGGFSFWIYSTTAIDGVNTSNFYNGSNGKFNDGVGINIPANTWTQVLVTAADMNPTRFLILQGNWAGTIYIDDIQPLDTSGLNTITYNANGGSVTSATQTVLAGAEYTLATPTAYRDFLGWVDENGNSVPMSGVWELGSVTLTATYSDKISFENGVVPTYLTKAGSTESLSVVTTDTTDGSKALKIQSTASGTTPALYATVEFLASFFEDESVDYIAFNAKTGSSRANNFRRYTMHSNGSMNNVTYEYDVEYNGIYADAWKTFYFSREDYNYWVANSVTANSLIATGGFNAGDYIYLDNIRAATAEEYAEGEYGFEIGGVRLDGNNLLFYTSRGQGTWQMGILPGAALTSYSYTNDIVSNGIRAFSFTQVANTTTTLRFNTNTTTQMQTDIMTPTGYYAFDLYVPEDANTTFTYNTTTYPGATPKKGDWTTVYVNNNTTFIKISDTTGSTYTIDNFRSITAEEYTAAMYGFEASTGGLRDNIESSNAFYYYMGADHTANKYSICASSSILTAASISSEVAHDGNYSLAFTKENGALNLQMRADSTAYALLKHGFTFWIYSTVGLNGISADNFINGNSAKFNDGTGMSVAANTWTQVTITEDDIKHATGEDPCPFLRLNGSTAGTYYIDGIEALPYVEPETLYYNATVESEEDGVRSGIVLGASSHTAGLDVLPQGTNDTEDMSYIKCGDSYGLNDFLVFDFTGDNVPLMSFFTTEVTNSVYNQAENAEVKGWVVANGMTTMRGIPYSGTASNLSNRLNVIGPYMISNLYDNTTGNTLAQIRASYGSQAEPSPITMPTLQAAGDVPYRMIVGWVENGSEMNLRMYVIDLTTGQAYVDYNLDLNITKADWEGDIALYGHFGRETVVDALYPIENDTTIEDVVAKYMPSTIVYNGAWDGDKLTLNQSIYDDGNVNSSSANSPTSADMSYIAFNGNYGLNDYVVFDMTGDNMPIVSFFNNEVTNTVFNNASAGGTIADESVRGWVWFNGLYRNNGVVYGGAATTNVHWQRLTLVGSHKVVGFDNNNNDFRLCLGSAADVNPLSIYALQSVTDTYRIILGVGAHTSASKVYMEMAAINMVTGVVVYQYQWEVSSVDFEEGSIALHGQFGKETVLDKVFGVEEDTTLDALIAKYAKDTDYSDETAVTLDRYAYSSLSDGQWTLDGTDQVTNPTDYRTVESTYTTYKNAGFNILLAQDMISTDGTKATWEASANKTYMDNAYNAGLKVILTDWHLQILSAPLKVSGSSVVASDSTYVPWIIGTDASATTGAAADYLGYLSSLGITVDSTRFTDRYALDKFVYSQLEPYMSHPAFYGVMLADEPSYHNAYCYGEIYKSIKRVMPDCYVQYNLLPLEHSFGTIQYRYPGVNDIGENITNAQIEAAYKSYVESYLDTMGTDYIQYDDYPFKSAEEGVLFWTSTEPYVDPTSLRNIQLVAEIAKERGLDVKVVSQSSLMKSGGADGAVHIRQVTENDARWLNNYLMGFGVKQINYFTYWTKRASTSDGEYFVDGGSFVNRDGTTTALYTFMQTIMADNDKFAPTISHFDYSASQVFGSNNDSNLNNDHISWSSSLTAAASFKWLSSITTGLEYTLVTELYDKDNYNYMYMVMNTIDPSEGGTQSITVTLAENVTSFYVYDQSGNRSELQTGNTYTVSLTAGQAIYILPCTFN